MTRLGDALEVLLGRRGAVRLEHQTEYAIRDLDGSIHPSAPGTVPGPGATAVVREVTVVREEWRAE